MPRTIEEKISLIKNYLKDEFSDIFLIDINNNNFKTFCRTHSNEDVHNTFTFPKNYITRKASPCKICRNNFRIKKIRNTLQKIHNSHEKEKIKSINIKNKQDEKNNKDYVDQIDKAKKIHENYYKYDKVTLENFRSKYWTIICPEHGEFKQLKKEHLRGHKCYKCYVKSISYDYDFFVKNFVKKDSPISISRDDYVDYNSISKFKCKKHGYFYITPSKLVNRGINYGCKKCFANKSLWEEEVKLFLDELNVSLIERNKIIKNGKSKFELDIFCPNENIGIECNGIYWHSSKFCDKNYHINKTNQCEKLGIRLIQIFEDEWKYKKDIVKNILRTIFNKNNNVEYARNLIIDEISEKTAKQFYDKYHIQGWCRSTTSLGAFNRFYQLVGCMSFSNKRPGIGSKTNNMIIELTRFATDGGRYPGLASKFFKYYLKNYYNGGKIISYADRRFYTGKVYPQLGFKHVRTTGPNYFYVIDNKRIHRFSFAKTRLKEIFGENICKIYSEREIMEGMDIPKVYDCGHIVFEYC
ncbi:MAG: hypothetical protein NZZ41_03110 [Candidatus Dojkabacteria bacterium]|nr:hypothetical protein [Candidatus Dojkabacteria bacterium]